MLNSTHIRRIIHLSKCNDFRMFLQPQINIWDTPHEQITNEKQKLYYHHNRHTKSICQNSTFLQNKTFIKLGVKGMYLDVIKGMTKHNYIFSSEKWVLSL